MTSHRKHTITSTHRPTRTPLTPESEVFRGSEASKLLCNLQQHHTEHFEKPRPQIESYITRMCVFPGRTGRPSSCTIKFDLMCAYLAPNHDSIIYLETSRLWILIHRRNDRVGLNAAHFINIHCGSEFWQSEWKMRAISGGLRFVCFLEGFICAIVFRLGVVWCWFVRNSSIRNVLVDTMK